MVVGLLLQAVKHAVGYLWPSYMTYKALHYADAEAQQRWTIYWCVMGCCMAAEFVTDVLLFWLPFYRMMKIGWVLYLWHPKTRGAQWIYTQFLSRSLKENEQQIDAAAAEAQLWLQEKSHVWKEQALVAVGKGAVAALAKVQEIGSPRIAAFTQEGGVNNVVPIETQKEK